MLDECVLLAVVRASLLADCLMSPGLERCGLIGGRDGIGTTLYPILNVAATPEVAFELDPSGHVAAMRCMRDANESLQGIYHSHPTAPARPSQRDLAMASYPGVPYLIVSLAERPPVLNAFVFTGERFIPVGLSVLDELPASQP